MKNNLKELYQSAIIITNPALDGKIGQIKLTPEHQAMHDKIAALLDRMKERQTALQCCIIQLQET